MMYKFCLLYTSRDFPLYITDDSHMPPEHLYYKEVNAHDGAYYRRWASVYGESMVCLLYTSDVYKRQSVSFGT